MPSDAVPADRGAAQWLPAPWRASLVALALVWLALIGLFLADWRAMAGQWWNSSTYNHILLIPPIIGWLVSQRLHDVLRLTPRGWWPGLVLFAGAGLVWVLGDLAGLAVLRQLAVVLMAQAGLAAVMGPEVVVALAFPLFYMLFLVPMGDELIPGLQTLTARLTMVFLGLAHIPATINGVFITTPAGYFEVAEACSGIKFLIAMVAYGALVANVCFLRWTRRALFMAVSVVVPIIANGLRAFGTIWIAGWYGIRFASSFDHVFYGWVFFALVMALCMAVGWRFFDRPVDRAMIDPDAIIANPVVRSLAAWRLSPAIGLPVMLALALGCIAWGGAAQSLAANVPQRAQAPQVPGWTAIAAHDAMPWVPLHGGADRQFHLRLRKGDAIVDVSLALYANQGTGREAGGFGQGALPLGSRWAWERPGPAMASAKSDVIQAPSAGPLPERRLCLTWYRSGGLLTGSNLALRLHVMGDHLALRRQVTAVLIVSASDRFNRDPAAALGAFLADIGPVDRWIDGVTGG